MLGHRHADNRTANKVRGRARRGKRAHGVVFFHRGQRYSALGVFSHMGMLDAFIVEGGFDAEQFMVAFKEVVLPQLNAYPEPNSVLVMDNCPGLHVQPEMVQLILEKGARVLWLEPYDPEHNPIELAFRTAKMTLKNEYESLSIFPRREQVRVALFRADHRAAKSHYAECGYDVSEL